VVAYPAWIVAGLGMGLVYPTLSVLTLELSAPGEQGVNSSALQVGEMVFTVVAIASTGALFLTIGYGAAFVAAVLLALTGLHITPRSVRNTRLVAAPN
jgi:MFS family permease